MLGAQQKGLGVAAKPLLYLLVGTEVHALQH
jgi:hypothetical protein